MPVGTNDCRPPPSVDAAKLDQILRLQEQLLIGDGVPQEVCSRVCQRAAVLLEAAAARLILLHTDGTIEVMAAYGSGDFNLAPTEALRTVADTAQPALHRSRRDGWVLLSLPLQTGEPAPLLQMISTPEAPFGVEQVAMARYTASLIIWSSVA